MPFCVFLLFSAVLVAAQFVPVPTDLTSATGNANIPIRYKQVPTGICEQDPNVKSYSGYADVAPNQHIFFWFFEARKVDPGNAPLTIWLNGGPGCSSMVGVFQENGPCRVDEKGHPVNNPYSWSNVSNMLYIDQPTQVGFSYTIPVPAVVDIHHQQFVGLPNNSCPEWASTIGPCGTFSLANTTLTVSDTIDAAPAVWATLQGFMGVFPQYARNKINLAAESYGGHYAPVFAEYFKTQTTGTLVDLDTVLIGNGWIDSSEVYQAWYNFTVSPGNTYDYALFNESVSSTMYDILWGPGNCVDQMNACKATNSSQICVEATSFCQAGVPQFYLKAHRDLYDIREPSNDPFPPTNYEGYLNSLEVQTAIGAYQNFTECSDFITTDFWQTNDLVPVTGLIEDFHNLISQDINIVLYHGDADFICNWMGGERVAYEIDAPDFAQAGYENISTPDHVVHGQVKQAGLFSFVRVYEAGHEVPFYQPELALTMFSRAISRKDIATGRLDANGSYTSTGDPESLFREGNKTVQFKAPPPGSQYNTTTGEPSKSSGSARLSRCAWTLWSITAVMTLVVLDVGDPFLPALRRLGIVN
jgi:carboxypeptidase C (cathepsin A)